PAPTPVPTLCPAPQAAAIPNLTKVSSTGIPLPVSSIQWSCVQDNNSGLMWEVKTDNADLHDKDWTYSWYQPNNLPITENSGKPNGGDCGKHGIDCDTESYVQAVNTEGLCGQNDWRMPTDEELLSLVDHTKTNPVIDVTYFPFTQKSMYWSSSTAENSNYAWYVTFGKGYHAWNLKESARYVRLVRTIK
ncbi:MAG: DUF1566 domain-containing protein, partial [Methylococcaceae bacterium]|nr:DUF1566 domain-containing protein [Methylococcaceae bacterium]